MTSPALVFGLAGSIALHLGAGLALASLDTRGLGPSGPRAGLDAGTRIALVVRLAAQTAANAPAYQPSDSLGQRPAITPVREEETAPALDLKRIVSTEPALSLPGPRYLTPQELTALPRALKPIEPSYPMRGGEVRHGTVVLRLLINSGGTVDQVLVEQSDVGGAFESEAIGAFSSARFRPAEKDGLPVNSQLKVEVTFETTEAAN
jgi:TonB family protein